MPPPAEGGELGTRRRAEGGPGPARRHRAGVLWFRGFRGPCRRFTVRSAASAPSPPTRRPAPSPETLLGAGGPVGALWSRGGRSSPGDAFGGRAGSQTRGRSVRPIPSARWRTGCRSFRPRARGKRTAAPVATGGRDAGEGGRLTSEAPPERGAGDPGPVHPAPAAPPRPRRASALGRAQSASRPRLERALPLRRLGPRERGPARNQ